ncbi:PepSY domain-containing protein [Actinomadura sp. SCN-SB]|uniref:PepSY domain-containing protein n=1 Tax=Actinomadura sp. SCN-SB TaxID=3373092 RepID=UPI003751170C
MKLAMGKALSRRGPMLAAAVAAGALAGVAGTSVATSVVGTDHGEGQVTARLSIAHAAETALEAVPGGHIEGLELDYNGRVLMWEVDVVAADGAMRELHIDSNERRVLANRLDPPEAGEDGDCAGDGDLTPGPSDQAAALRAARISAVQAGRIASEVQPGTVTSVDFASTGRRGRSGRSTSPTATAWRTRCWWTRPRARSSRGVSRRRTTAEPSPSPRFTGLLPMDGDGRISPNSPIGTVRLERM